uniref:Metallophosphoesterase n=1 Tax=Clandestinovirus TaxID=2831644 RepID=A0A8F8KNR4_9VIRU|nr:metallophosphoesterase [Clandestinovirus]
MRKNIVQYISDLHLGEMFFGHLVVKVPEIEPLAPTLVIAGDLGNPLSSQYTRFLKMHSKRFDNIIVVAGNHEFYHSVSGTGDDRTYTNGLMNVRQAVDSIDRCKFLERDSIVIGNIRIAGCTLWTKVDPHFRFTKYMYDTRRIKSLQSNGKAKSWCPLERNYVHNQSLDYIRKTMNQTKDEHLLIVTHHVPLEPLITKTTFPKNIHQRMIGNAEQLLLDDSKTKHRFDRAWVFGHNHWTYSTQQHYGWSFYSNPCPVYKSQTRMQPKLIHFGE